MRRINFSEAIDRAGECWLWTRGKTRSGYGKVRGKDGRATYAHRLAWEEAHGEIPAGMHVLHRCDTPACCRPDHLFLGTHSTNMADMKQKLRQAFGERNGRRKLSVIEVQAIRAESEHSSQRALAKKFGVSQWNIRLILHGETWSNV